MRCHADVRFVAFNEFIHERETKGPADSSIMLFDQIILAKKNRGKSSIFSKSSMLHRLRINFADIQF